MATGHTAVYFSFDHDNTTLIERLIAMEAAEIAGLSGVSLKRVRGAFEARQRSEPKFERRLAGTEAGVEAVQELREYGRRLHLHRSKSSDTDVEAMKKVIETIREDTGQAPFVAVAVPEDVLIIARRPNLRRVAAPTTDLRDWRRYVSTGPGSAASAVRSDLAQSLTSRNFSVLQWIMTALQSTTTTEMVTGRLQSLHSFLEETNDRLKAGQVAGSKVWPSGFGALDKALTGGFRSGELVLLGGPQGLGKTTFGLQVMRNLIASKHSAVYFSFEHDNHTLLERLIAMEAAEIAGPTAVPLHRVRQAFEARHSSKQTLEGRLDGTLGGVEAVQALQGYARRLHLHRSNGSDTDVEAMRRVIETIREETGEEPFVVVDYLQKVHVPDSAGQSEDERVTLVVEALKDLALELTLPVVAIVAADKSGLAHGKRMRVHDLRGSSALAYEPDIVLIINDKYDVVARHHLIYDVANADRFRGWVVMTIEKNRNGVDKVDLEFRKRFDQGRFDTGGGYVAEQLIDERVFVE